MKEVEVKIEKDLKIKEMDKIQEVNFDKVKKKKF